MEKVELLAPAGDLERLKMAILYGADGVYLGGQIFGMRAAAKNFSIEDIEEGVAFAHQRGVKVYMTLNIIPHNEDFEGLEEYLQKVEKAGIDAVIVSDPGTFELVRETLPEMDIHISTQANTTNYRTINFWHKMGAERVVLARELNFTEIREIREKIDPQVELEAFVHGAMCISYSGRCLLSNYMANRDANRGACAQPCRWNYYLVEEQRPGEYMPIYQDEKGTYFMNSKDLSMIGHIPEMINSGIKSLKIEGRMKTIYYVATIVRAYRMAIDAYYEDPENWTFKPEWLQEIKKVSHREFTTGFYFDKPDEKEHIYADKTYHRDFTFVGLVKSYDEETGTAVIQQRNRFFKGDTVEIVGPEKETRTQKIREMINEEGVSIDVAPHPKQLVRIPVDGPVKPYDMLRKERMDHDES